MSGRLGVAVVVVLTAMLLAGCKGTSEQSRYRESLPAFEDVQFVAVGVYPLWNPSPLPLTPRDDEKRLRWMLAQLSAARITDGDSDPGSAMGHMSPRFGIVVAGEQRVTVAPALDCVTDSFKSEYCRVHPSHVLVSTGEKTWRVNAPALANWMREQWFDDVRMGTPEELEAFMTDLRDRR